MWPACALLPHVGSPQLSHPPGGMGCPCSWSSHWVPPRMCPVHGEPPSDKVSLTRPDAYTSDIGLGRGFLRSGLVSGRGSPLSRLPGRPLVSPRLSRTLIPKCRGAPATQPPQPRDRATSAPLKLFSHGTRPPRFPRQQTGQRLQSRTVKSELWFVNRRRASGREGEGGLTELVTACPCAAPGARLSVARDTSERRRRPRSCLNARTRPGPARPGPPRMGVTPCG